MRHKTLIATCLVLILFATSIGSLAVAKEDVTEQFSELEEKIKEYELKIKQLEGQGKTLKREIEYSDTQISLTETRIENALYEIGRKNAEIAGLETEIDTLVEKINNLSDSVEIQENLLENRLRARYKVPEPSTIVVILGSSTLNSIIQKAEYLQVAQRKDKRLLDQMIATKNNYAQQQFMFEIKKEQVENLRAQIVQEKVNLESFREDLKRQKEDKQELLERTENDENKFQALLEQVRSELAALQLAINLPEGEGAEIKEGDIIGYMGNTGCSSGPHLHFGFVDDGKAKDPFPRLKEGKLKWPVDSPIITQSFGANYSFYMNNFGIPGHDALDIASADSYSGAPIRAAKDGELYYAKDAKVYCSWLNNSIGKGAIIDHGDGERTIYWHLQ